MDSPTITGLVLQLLDAYQAVNHQLSSNEKTKETLGLFERDSDIFRGALEKTLLKQLESNREMGTQLTMLVERVQEALSLRDVSRLAMVDGSGAIASGDGVGAGEGGYAAGRDIIIQHYQPEMSEKKAGQLWRRQAKFLQIAMEDYLDRLRKQLYTSFANIPYKGLLNYEGADKDIFFGREKEIAQLLNCIQSDGKESRVTVLHAPSGAGKTSLILAGVMPRLQDTITLYALPKLGKNYQGPEETIRKRILDASRHPGMPPLDLSQLTLHQFLGLASLGLRDKPLVIFLDQFEDFFIYQTPEAQQLFISALAECYDDQMLPVKFVLALRKEYFSDLDKLKQAVPTIFYNSVKLDPLTLEQAAQAVEGPLKKLSIEYQPQLVKEILDDLVIDELGRGRVEPPQLQIVCRHLYQAGRGNAITLDDYQKAGRAVGILSAHVSRVMDQFGPDQQILIQKVLAALITREETKRTLTHAELETEIGEDKLDTLLADLVDERLLRCDDTSEGLQYELAHQYLIKEIRETVSEEEWRLKGVRELLERELLNWRNNPESVIPPDRLQIIKQWRSDGRLSINEEAKALIEKSIQKRAEAEQKQMDIIQSVRMTSLDQLVIGIDREISTPIAAIKTNSQELRYSVEETRAILEQLPKQLIELSKNRTIWPTLEQHQDSDEDNLLRLHLHQLFEAVSRHVIKAVSQNVDQYFRDKGLWNKLEDIFDILEEVQEATQKMAGLLTALSSFVRSDQVGRPIDAHRQLENALLLLKGRFYSCGIIVKENFAYDTPLRIIGSPGQLVLLFMNILLNSIEAIEAKETPGFKGVIEINAHYDHYHKIIVISDNGIGIAEDRQKQLFRHDFSTKGLHRGLGLAIAKQIVERHRGSINITSQSGKGTNVKIRLPLFDLEDRNEQG